MLPAFLDLKSAKRSLMKKAYNRGGMSSSLSLRCATQRQRESVLFYQWVFRHITCWSCWLPRGGKERGDKLIVGLVDESVARMRERSAN